MNGRKLRDRRQCLHCAMIGYDWIGLVSAIKPASCFCVCLRIGLNEQNDAVNRKTD